MDKSFEDVYYLRNLTDDFVFCPKCGTRNVFKLSRAGTELKYFCERCNERLNDYWEGAQSEQLSIAECKSCLQPTFEELKYCISCGSIQRKVARKRAKEISSAIGDGEMDGDVAIQAAACCFLGPFPKFFKRNPAFAAIFFICIGVVTVFLILLILFWVLC
ncbi:MAG: hypothetical protein FK732_07420 [Asgard group archaeon]|nr:hypothetical protein [Asgard group archaeon]